MKTLKMSLETIQGKMNRMEMRNIMAGTGGNTDSCTDLICTSSKDCCPADPICRKMANDPRSACINY